MMKSRVRDTARDITSDYYDEGYFTSDTKQYEEKGELKSWGYLNPTGEWEPACDIAKVWKEMFNPSYVVDCGAGRGTFVKALKEEGVNVKGFDFSEFAVKHPCCNKEDIFLANILDVPLEDNIADLTLVLDICEHLYFDEIDTALSEIIRITKPSGYIFFNIGGILEKEVFLKRGEPIPSEFEGVCAAGHVSYAPLSWWRNKLKSHRLNIRDDLTEQFQSSLPEEYLTAWNITIVEK